MFSTAMTTDGCCAGQPGFFGKKPPLIAPALFGPFAPVSPVSVVVASTSLTGHRHDPLGHSGAGLCLWLRGTGDEPGGVALAPGRRLATFSAGTVLGELALLDAGPRSASVEADEDLICYALTEHAFEALKKDHPLIAVKLLTNVGRDLSRRLRRANRTIFELEG
jgi:CRP-like cAMP-binding protein